MGFRFRKSFKIIPGVRVNLTHRGIGMSIGGRRGRISINSRGRTTTTFGIPETGLSYTHTTRLGGRKNSGANNRSNRVTTNVEQSELGLLERLYREELEKIPEMKFNSKDNFVTLKNIVAIILILVGLIFLFFSVIKGIVFIALGVVLWNILNINEEDVQHRQRLKEEVLERVREEVTRIEMEQQQQQFEREERERQEEQDRRNYDFIQINFPEIAPKSFAGYMRMKNGRTENFMQLVDLAREKGINII